MPHAHSATPIATFQDLIEASLAPDPQLDPACRPLSDDLAGMPVTFASMIMTDGTTTYIGIYRGLMVGPRGKRYINWNVSTTVRIATEVVKGGDHVSTVKRLSSKYATADWPAVDWSR
jgi:hypothetical protein